MFQYAAARSLSNRLRSSLNLDISWFDEIKGNPEVVQRIYELDVFGIRPNPLNLADMISLKISPYKILVEDPVARDKQFKDLAGNIYMDGYWQSEDYFRDIGQDIARAFTLASRLSKPKQKIARIVHEDGGAVSLNVRRSDYVTHGGSKSLLGALGLSYYDSAVSYISQKIKHPHFYIISDDTDWCRKNLKFNHPMTFVEHIPNTGHEDMHLISLCKHHIIANSTFSWWGAWLNPNPDKIVIGPKRWYAKKSFGISPMPKSWISI